MKDDGMSLKRGDRTDWAPKHLLNMNGKDTPDAILRALAANRAYAEGLQQSIAKLTKQETELRVGMQLLRQRLARRRAERAMTALGWTATTTQGNDQNALLSTTSGDGFTPDVFAREIESRYKRVGVVPRSYIRQKPSFFNSPEKRNAHDTMRKRQRRATTVTGSLFIPQIDLTKETEPFPNLDTYFLRQHSHAAFMATPPKLFTPKEREIVDRFAHSHLTDSDLAKEIPLQTWNEISKVNKPPIHRSGFACKLQWELHDNPILRLGAWTKDEDSALKDLASGAADKTIVNRWSEISKRMPLSGRPPVHCLIRYMTKLCPSNLNDKFTPEEDEMLRRAVDVFGERWTIIADLMDGRIAEQLRHRWQLSLSPNVKLGKFSIVEDRRLLLALYAYFDRENDQFQRDSVQWHQICHHIPGRPSPPVRDRFVSSLNPDVTFRDWLASEDEIIRSTVRRLGFDAVGLWPSIAAQLGNRTDNQVARRARTLMPVEYSKNKQRKLLQGGRKSLPTIFNRTIAARRDWDRPADAVAAAETYDNDTSGSHGDRDGDNTPAHGHQDEQEVTEVLL